MSSTTLRFYVAACLAITACGDEPAPPPGVDAGAGGNAGLFINDPPGESLGLSFGGSETLSVTYVDASGEPIAGGEVRFRMRTSGSENTGGSTLSSNTVLTDGDGVAEVSLVAGAERVNFRIEASASDAPSAMFYIAVSEEGFTDLLVEPVHDGFRSPADALPVQIRLYRADEHGCADIDLDDIPPSLFPAGEISAFGEQAAFRNRSSGDGYTVLAWGDHPSGGVPLSAGCVDLNASQMRPGYTIRLSVILRDRPAELPEVIELHSRFDLSLLRQALAEAGADEAWDALARCEAGPGQIALDCALAARAGEATCRHDGEGDALIAEIEALRGDPDDAGCRPLERGGEPTLDALLADAMLDGTPSAADFVELALAQRELVSEVEIRSRLWLPSANLATHRLDELSFHVEGDAHSIDLGETSRPVLLAEGIPTALSPPGGGQFEIGEHDFTARLGSGAASAFRELALAPRDLLDLEHALGSALIATMSDAETGDQGCAAMSAIACRAVDRAESCLESACSAGEAALDAELGAWAELADGAASDLVLSGAAPAVDDGDNLIIDRFGETPAGGAAGTWAATLFLANGTPVDLVGSFRGEIP